MRIFAGLGVSSGLITVCFQALSWVVRSETGTDFGASWLNSYVGSAALLIAIATVRAVFTPGKNA